MVGLSKNLGGNFSIENENGTKIKISFVHDRGDISTNSFS
jgi:hypothetical protein